MKDLIQLNDHLLAQASKLVEGEMADLYACPCVPVFSSTIGQHLRHCVEHYEELLGAIGERRPLDYEARPRDLAVETDPEIALARIDRIRRDLKALRGGGSIGVLDTGTETPAPSSIERELQYLVSHTVHHFALISVISGHHGLKIPADFGVAPSTLKYRQSA